MFTYVSGFLQGSSSVTAWDKWVGEFILKYIFFLIEN